MRIAQVAPPFESVPPSGYGGTERVVSTLTEELVRRGHQVTLFASGDSRTAARLESTVDEVLWHREPPFSDLNPFWAMILDAIWAQVDEFDVIHSHLDYWGYPLARHAGVPVVTTLHGRLDLPELQPLYRRFCDVPLVSISDAQRRPVPWANWVGTVYHGIEFDQFTFNPQPARYLAFVGRISPLLHGDHARLIGEVAGVDKDRFLGHAAALLFPIRWPEPFGLVMAEALACGTPVIALGRGSVPEVIEDGVTGFICSNEDELVAALGRLREVTAPAAAPRQSAASRPRPWLRATSVSTSACVRAQRASPRRLPSSMATSPTAGDQHPRGWVRTTAGTSPWEQTRRCRHSPCFQPCLNLGPLAWELQRARRSAE